MLSNLIIKIHGDIKKELSFDDGVNFLSINNDEMNILNVIEYALGGNLKNGTSSNIIDGARVYITFTFGDESYYFIRAFNDSQYISKCDKEFNKKEEWTTKKYDDWLSANYNTINKSITFQEKVNIFSHTTKMLSLYETAKQGSKEDKKLLLQLLDMYEPIEKAIDEKRDAQKKKNTYNAACKYGYIECAKDNVEIKNNRQLMADITKELSLAREDIKRCVVSEDVNDFKRYSRIKEEYCNLEINRISIESKLKRVENNLKCNKRNFEGSFKHLQNYFPDINISLLESAEAFHKEMTSVLKDELEERAMELRDSHEKIIKKLNGLKDEWKLLASIDENVDDVILKSKKLDKLKIINDNYQTKKKLEQQFEDKKLDLARVESLQENTCFEKISTQIENDLSVMADNNYNPYVRSLLNYVHKNINDNSEMKGIFSIIADIAIMELTGFPFLFCGKELLYGLDKKRKEAVLQCLAISNKQVFVVK